jgi:hypothetical protein
MTINSSLKIKITKKGKNIMLENNFAISIDQYRYLNEKLLDIKSKIDLGLNGGCPYDPVLIRKVLDSFSTDNIYQTNQIKFLRLISNGVNLIINSVKGTSTIDKATEVFKAGIDTDFKDLGNEQPSNTTDKTFVEVYEMVVDSTLTQMFGSLSSNLETLCLKQHQIVKFCAEYPNWLKINGYATFFLFKANKKNYAAYVRIVSGLLNINVLNLENNFIWCSKETRRVVVPVRTNISLLS